MGSTRVHGIVTEELGLVIIRSFRHSFSCSFRRSSRHLVPEARADETIERPKQGHQEIAYAAC
jgi:hypothetical protein